MKKFEKKVQSWIASFTASLQTPKSLMPSVIVKPKKEGKRLTEEEKKSTKKRCTESQLEMHRIKNSTALKVKCCGARKNSELKVSSIKSALDVKS